MHLKKLNSVRKGIKDIWWKAYMVDGAEFSPNDIPYCPTTATELPRRIITYREARDLYRRELRRHHRNFRCDAFVCFYEDDQGFDSTRGIWFCSILAYRVLVHFAGIITPDFSTNQDFPMPLKLWNVYRMRAFGYWYGTICGHQVINNVRWGTRETYWFDFDGIERNGVVAIGTVGGSPFRLLDRPRFEEGLEEMVRVLSPHTIIVYGSANYDCFRRLEAQGITIVSYPGRTSQVMARRAGK